MRVARALIPMLSCAPAFAEGSSARSPSTVASADLCRQETAKVLGGCIRGNGGDEPLPAEAVHGRALRLSEQDIMRICLSLAEASIHGIPTIHGEGSKVMRNLLSDRLGTLRKGK